LKTSRTTSAMWAFPVFRNDSKSVRRVWILLSPLYRWRNEDEKYVKKLAQGNKQFAPQLLILKRVHVTLFISKDHSPLSEGGSIFPQQLPVAIIYFSLTFSCLSRLLSPICNWLIAQDSRSDSGALVAEDRFTQLVLKVV
jgi:hypothetical protein